MEHKHCTHHDIVAELNTFGIGSNLLTGDPWSEEATMVIREWFAMQRLKESQRQEAQLLAVDDGGSSSESNTAVGSSAPSDARQGGIASLSPVPTAATVGVTSGRRLTKEDIGPYDVIFGRGKGAQAHPGNKRLRDHVETNLSDTKTRTGSRRRSSRK